MLAKASRILTLLLQWQIRIFPTAQKKCSAQQRNALTTNGRHTSTAGCLSSNSEHTGRVGDFLFAPGNYHAALNWIPREVLTPKTLSAQAKRLCLGRESRKLRQGQHTNEVRAQQQRDSFPSWSIGHILGSSHNASISAKIPTRKLQPTVKNDRTRHPKSRRKSSNSTQFKQNRADTDKIVHTTDKRANQDTSEFRAKNAPKTARRKNHSSSKNIRHK
jgi:hypothetical protein